MREKLIDLLMDLPVTRLTYEEMEKYSEDVAEYLIANDVVQVVRCKDCKYFNCGYCDHDKLEHSGCREDAFCSYGERKDNES